MAKEEPHDVSEHLLGPHVVGRRVVVRRVVPGETGPSGGPLLTDVIGHCEAWVDNHVMVRRDDGSAVAIPLADIVSGKPVPPRPSVRLRITPLEAQLRSLAMWPDVETEQLGDWVLRVAPDPVRRANSALAMGKPGTSLGGAVERIVEFYAAKGTKPIVMVEADSDVCASFQGSGWVVDRPHEPDTLFLVSSVWQAIRALQNVERDDLVLTEDGPRLEAHVGDVAQARAAYDRDWVGLHALNVEPSRRRQGLALALVDAMLEWAAERGATTAYLQVLEDNVAARGLYERLGFTVHHAYRYLTPGPQARS